MPHRRKPPNRFYKLQAPVHLWHDWRENTWVLLDRMNTIIAKDLTKELAETLMQAVNFCGTAIDFTTFFVKSESITGYTEDASSEEILQRNDMIIQAIEFLVDLGIIEPPPKYIDGLPEWKKQLENELTDTVNSR